MKSELLLFFSILSTIVLAQPPTASFSVNKFEICAGESITLTSTSTPGAASIVKYFWSVPGGQPASAEGTSGTFTTTFPNAGTYDLSLIVQSADGLSDGEVKFGVLKVNANPVSDPKSSLNSCEAPFQVNYTAGSSSSGSGISYAWTFTGGSPASSGTASQLVSYPNTGTVGATLTVSSSVTGCKTTTSINTTLSSYQADFTLPAEACIDTKITLSDASSTGTNSWQWTFQNGTPSSASQQNPQVSFTQTGSQTISLKATNTLTGCTKTMTKTIFINPLPSPSFVTSLPEACRNDAITFTNQNIQSGATYEWLFDDGTTITGANPGQHAYVTEGEYNPKLIMIDSKGCTDTTDTYVSIRQAKANMTISRWQGCTPALVDFVDESTSPRTITGWKWDFGDGNTSTLQNPQNTFFCGRFDVQLIITTAGSCTDTVRLSSVVPLNKTIFGLTTLPDDDGGNNHTDNMLAFGDSLLKPDFTYDKNHICAKSEVLELESIVNIPCTYEKGEVKYLWTMLPVNQTTESDSSFFKKNFNDTMFNGPITIRHSVSFRGCESPFRDSVDLLWIKAPFANAIPDKSPYCNEGSVVSVFFNDAESVYGHANQIVFAGDTIENQAIDDVRVTWDFGDGSPLLVIDDDALLEDFDKGSVTHTFNGYGTYEVLQRIDNYTLDCWAEKLITVAISELQADVMADSLCIGESELFQFQINTPSVHPILVHYYFLHDDTIERVAPDFSYTHTYKTAGVYTENFSIVNDAGCEAKITKDFYVFDLPKANISLVSDSVCEQEIGLVNPNGSSFGNFSLNPNAWSSFEWRFDDGTSDQISTDFSNVSTLPIDLGSKVRVIMQATDAFGCKSLPDTNYIVTQKPTAAMTLSPIICDGVNGLIPASATKGNGPLTFNWFMDGVALSGNNDTLDYVVNVNPALTSESHVFTLIVSDNHGCTDTISKTVSVRNPIINGVSYVTEGTSVDDQGNYTCPPVIVDFTIDYLSQDPISKYAWSLGNDLDTDVDSDKENPDGIQYHFAGSYAYSVEITDANGCTASFNEDPFLVIAGPSAKPIITLDSTDICRQTYLFQVTDTNSVTNWEWRLGDGTTVSSSDHPNGSFTYRYDEVSDYEPLLLISDTIPPPGCSVPYTGLVLMDDNGLNAYFTADPTEINIGGSVLVDEASTFVGAPIVNWVWNYGDGQIDTLDNSNNQTHNYQLNGTYPIELTVIDTNGCTDKHRVIIVSNLVLIMPNVITAVGTDGVNSIWRLYADIFQDFEILIVNRWGNEVYRGGRNSTDPRFLWDGIDFKTAKPCTDGVYFWVIEGKLLNGTEIKEHGYLSLIGYQQ